METTRKDDSAPANLGGGAAQQLKQQLSKQDTAKHDAPEAESRLGEPGDTVIPKSGSSSSSMEEASTKESPLKCDSGSNKAQPPAKRGFGVDFLTGKQDSVAEPAVGIAKTLPRLEPGAGSAFTKYTKSLTPKEMPLSCNPNAAEARSQAKSASAFSFGQLGPQKSSLFSPSSALLLPPPPAPMANVQQHPMLLHPRGEHSDAKESKAVDRTKRNSTKPVQEVVNNASAYLMTPFPALRKLLEFAPPNSNSSTGNTPVSPTVLSSLLATAPASSPATSSVAPSSSMGISSASNTCAKCGITFRMTSDLVYHMRTHHTRTEGETSYEKRREFERLKCTVCGENFKERHHLTRHMTAHQDRKRDPSGSIASLMAGESTAKKRKGGNPGGGGDGSGGNGDPPPTGALFGRI